MIALYQNGEPLTCGNGHPMRLVPRLGRQDEHQLYAAYQAARYPPPRRFTTKTEEVRQAHA
jgi:hypothetical protein